MVRTLTRDDETTLVLSPNRSMSWRHNLYLMLGVSLWVSLIGIGFWIIGAWPVAPFVGVEILCLFLGLWYSHRNLMRREVLSISNSSITFEEGVGFPRSRVTWRRDAVRGQVLRIGHPQQSPWIALYDGEGRHCRIGAFLSKADCDLLIVLLKRQGIHLKTATELVTQPF